MSLKFVPAILVTGSLILPATSLAQGKDPVDLMNAADALACLAQLNEGRTTAQAGNVTCSTETTTNCFTFDNATRLSFGYEPFSRK
ncbi:MAG: hypothetical protein AB7E52_05595, partial [Bdellovibrionales bacterium]